VAAMRAAGVSRLHSFSVGFAEASANELPFARVAARAFATDHREVVVGADEFFAALPKLSWHRDAPLTFSASIPLYFVSRLAHDHVKVVLTGEGSDELFAGYGRYPRALWNRSIAAALDRVLSSGTRARLAASARAFGDGYLGSRLQRSFVARHGTLEDSYLEAFADFDARHRASLLGRLDGVEAFGDLGRLIDRELLARNPLEAMLRLDQATYLEELLMKQDQMSMAASIESRVPFLDHRLVAWSATLPSSAKLSRFTGKALVREAGLRHLPREIARGEKRGFPVPMAAWLRGPGLAWLHRYSPARTDELLDARYVSRLLAEHVAGRDHTARLWRVLAFQVWRHEVLAPARTELARSARPRPALA